MSLEGQRAWIGEVERKLGKRTRVFLALAVIAIGIGGAAIYLAIDARESSVSEGDLQELQQQLEAQIDEAPSGSAAIPEQVEPAPERTPESNPESEPESQDDATGGASPGASSRGAGGNPPSGAADSSRIPELLEEAEEENAQAEREQSGQKPGMK